MIFWHVITLFGDTNATLPAAAGIFCCLLAGRAWSAALRWALLFGGALFLTAATKIAFVGWGIGIRSLDFTGISGHAMRATAVFPPIAWLLTHKHSPRVRAIALAAGFLASGLISFSRIALQAHSISEAIAGCLLGAAVALAFMRTLNSMRIAAAHRWIVFLSLLAMLPTFRVGPAPTESWVTRVALYLSGHEQPYRRTEWLRMR